MEKAKKILDWIWLIVKITFAIALIIVGIKLILWLVFPLFSLWFIPSPFSSFDWNPIVTFLGAIITAGATFCAVYLTSKEDRKARFEEKKINYYMSSLQLLDNDIKYLRDSIYCFSIYEPDPINILSRTGEITQKWYQTHKIVKLIKKLEAISNIWKNKNYSVLISELVQIQKLYNVTLDNESRGVDNAENVRVFEKIEKNDVRYSIPRLLNLYETQYNKQFNYKQIEKIIDEMQALINNEFKLEDK